MLYPRKIEKNLQNEISTPEAVVLTGMRRTGKTTIMKKILNSLPTTNKIYLDLENPLNRKIFEEVDFDNIWQNLKLLGISKETKAYIFLDEIQLTPGIPNVVKYFVDHYQTKFFLTGSSSYYLKNLFSESLSGRKVVFELFPLDFEEFLWFKNKRKIFETTFSEKARKKNSIQFELYQKYFDEYLKFGGFPSIVLEESFEKKRNKLNEILTSYFELDVKTLADFKNIGKLRDLLVLLASRCGSKLEITKISRELETSRVTIYSYLSFLEKTFFIFLVAPFSLNPDREISGAKKVYFCDTGMLNLLSQPSVGALLENGVFNNLKKFGGINYYQKRTGAEIDFILNQKIALEIKNKGNLFDWRKSFKLADKLKLKETYVISKEYSQDKGVILATDV